MPLDPRQEQELVGGGDSLLHYHLADRATNAGLQSDARVVGVSTTTYAVRDGDDFLVCDTTLVPITVTLPLARNGREIEVVYNAGVNNITLLPQTGDTTMGTTSITMTLLGMALRLKAVDNNWVII